jgi:protein dithiol oxidoreductase (disulfide-forming)
MKRRYFTAQMLGVSAGLAGLGHPTVSLAQGAPVEGKQYVRLSQPLPAPTGGKVEVIEFFWYGCPHCKDFEPSLEAWVKKLPAEVQFRRVPVAFRDEPFGAHQRIYYALEAMDQVEALHRKVFYAIHNDRQRLDKPADIAAFMAKNGLDSAKFLDAYNSFGVQTKAKQAKQLSESYRIDGVPALGIHGRYYTSGTLAGSPERALAVTDYLIQQVRKGG